MAFKGITAFILNNGEGGGGGGGGSTNYNDLTNHPQINGNELIGNKTAAQLGLLPADTDIPTKLSDLDEDTTHRTVTDSEKQSWNNKVNSVAGKGLSTNDYTDDDKADVAKIDTIEGNVGTLTSSVGIVQGKVTTLEGQMLSVQDDLNDKVNKETGKGLSTNDYSNTDKAIVDGVTTALAGKVDTSSVGTANGVAGLDNTGRVPSSQLPSYVDDVLEYASLSAFPETGEGGKIYIALDTNKTYRWSGSAYVEISESLALGETQGTAYEGNKGKANADAIDTLETAVEAIPDQIETVVKDTVGWVGKNLSVPYTYSTGGSEFLLTYDNNKVTVNGTLTSVDVSQPISSVARNNGYVFDLPAGTYTISLTGDTANLEPQIVKSDGSVLEGTTIILDTPTTIFVRVMVKKGNTFNNQICYIQLEKGSTATAYEPYHESVDESKADNTVIGTVEDGTNPTKSYAVGEHFIRNRKFCTVTVEVTTSSTWTLGSNYVEGTIADNLVKRDTFSGTTSVGGNIALGNTRKILSAFVTDADKTYVALPYINGYNGESAIHIVQANAQTQVVAEETVSGIYYYI